MQYRFNPDILYKSRIEKEFLFIVDEGMILKLLKSLIPSKAAGIDGLTGKFLKEAGQITIKEENNNQNHFKRKMTFVSEFLESAYLVMANIQISSFRINHSN